MVNRHCAFLLGFSLLLCSQAAAQEPQQEARRSTLLDVAKQIATDPTTYAPAALLYSSMRMDWNSSQALFQRGFVEDNARYTRSGLPHDVPISYAAGNRRILKQTLAVIPSSIANNAVTRLIERKLIDRFPQHRKTWKTISWIERLAFASYTGYLMSGPHFEQWKKNERMAGVRY